MSTPQHASHSLKYLTPLAEKLPASLQIISLTSRIIKFIEVREQIRRDGGQGPCHEVVLFDPTPLPKFAVFHKMFACFRRDLFGPSSLFSPTRP
jgi:hypothetical protein